MLMESCSDWEKIARREKAESMYVSPRAADKQEVHLCHSLINSLSYSLVLPVERGLDPYGKAISSRGGTIPVVPVGFSCSAGDVCCHGSSGGCALRRFHGVFGGQHAQHWQLARRVGGFREHGAAAEELVETKGGRLSVAGWPRTGWI